MSSAKHAPYKQGLLLWIAISALSFALLVWQISVSWPLLLIIALNVSAFCLYGIDKMLATNQARRIPEYVLYLAAFTGGAIGALSAMQIFRHKTSKVSFQFTLAFIILLEIIIFIAWLKPDLITDVIKQFS